MKKYAIGIMSGTSLDGIDVVLCEIEGSFRNTKLTVINAKTYSYEPNLLERIKQCIHLEESNVALICSVNFEIAKAYSDCVFDLCADAKIEISDISFIASHGQTVFHVAEDSEEYVKSSLQIGDGSVLANLTNTTVVSNFRTADIAVGGCGAPLVPYADYILFQNSNKTRLLQNIGGISNVTVVPKQGNLQDVFAFDNGPGNMMIDMAMRTLYGLPYDDSGKIAKTGSIIPDLLRELIRNPYFQKQPPKSTGRELFGDQYTTQILQQYENHPHENIIATLTHFTAKTISDSYRKFIEPEISIDEIIVSGGGAFNQYLLELIQAYSKEIPVVTLETYGMDSSYKEAVAFVVLGNETLHFNYSNVLRATGAKKHTILGQVSYVIKNGVEQ